MLTNSIVLSGEGCIVSKESKYIYQWMDEPCQQSHQCQALFVEWQGVHRPLEWHISCIYFHKILVADNSNLASNDPYSTNLKFTIRCLPHIADHLLPRTSLLQRHKNQDWKKWLFSWLKVPPVMHYLVGTCRKVERVYNYIQFWQGKYLNW